MERPILGKVIIRGIILCETGLHIGASRENLEIGAIDAPVVRDPLTKEPYIPGSSLKGKLRSLLEKLYTSYEVDHKKYPIFPNRSGGSGTKRHECDDWEPDDNAQFPGSKYCPVCRLFGATKKKVIRNGQKIDGKNWPARLIVRDAFITRDSKERLETIETGLLYTEWKWENSLDRVTASANPRQLERVPRGTKFELELVYTVENEEEMEEDLQNLKKTLELLEMDYLGGHGSRGYGQVKIKNLEITGRKFTNGEVKEIHIENHKKDDLKGLNELITQICQDFKK